jgi:carbonic anhydrase
MKGNERFVKGDFIARDLSSTKREELAKEQQPFAVVLACSDSRVAPELVFDQSLGDLYVVRVAGNVLDKAAIGSIEYAAEHLNTPLIFVLGHEKCGAVTAAVKNEGLEGNVIFLVNEIKPALARAKTMGGDLIAKTVDENVRNVVDTMPARSEILTKLIKENKVKIAGGTYNLTTGKINIVSELSAGAQAAAANEQ